jgi:hypothetical protein
MVSQLHEVTHQWLSSCINILQLAVDNHDNCRKPHLHLHGSGALKVVGLDRDIHRYMPDQGIKVFDSGTKKYLWGGYPTIVVEVAHSQTIKSVLDRAWEWLWGSNFHVQAVVVYNTTYLATSTTPFEARISIWVRLSNDIGKYCAFGNARVTLKSYW